MPDPRLIRQWQVKEGFVLPDDLVQTLPSLPRHHPFARRAIMDGYDLERLAARTRLLPYRLSVLVVGSGNGWAANYLAQLEKTTVLGIDFLPENHDQARRVFGWEDNPEFQLADIFADPINPASFDLVVLHGIAELYPDVGELLGQALEYLNAQGEVHVLGSPFWDLSRIEAAKKKKAIHFEQLGLPRMKEHYHFHSVEEMTALGAHLLHNPYRRDGGLRRKALNQKDSPHPWWMLPGSARYDR